MELIKTILGVVGILGIWCVLFMPVLKKRLRRPPMLKSR